MLTVLTEREESKILDWIRRDIKSGENLIGEGSQADVHLYREDHRNYVIKVASGWGISRLVRGLMLRNEYRAYRQLAKFEGVPSCYGFLEGRYLVLEYIDARSLREAKPADPDSFYAKLFDLIEGMHRSGVAHGDLRNKKNVLIGKGQNPITIDFGIAVSLKKKGSAINGRLFEALRQADYNAWVKLKYRLLKYAPDHDRNYFRWTPFERLWRLKKRYRKRLRRWQQRRVA
jgi:tRNA A-37 threonylcarbamoyl transferase component Bud32